MRFIRLVAPLLAVALGACERVVSVDAPAGPVRLVVQARLERVLGRASSTQTVRLTTTTSYFDRGAPPSARGATVRVTDETGAVTAFVESSPGVYTTNALVPVTGRAYTLAIDWNGQHYESTERVLAVPPIDTLYFAPPEFLIGDTKPGPRATIDFRDPRGVSNRYLWEQYVNGTRLLGPDSTMYQPVIGEDQGLDGRRLRRVQPFSDIVIAPGSTVIVRQLALSESLYRYFLALGEQTTNDGSPFAVPASSVRGNIANRTDPSSPPLGYFLATEVSEKTATLAK